MVRKFLICGFAIAILSACAGYKGVDSTKTIAVGDIIIAPQIGWTNIPVQGTLTMWTVNGTGLDELYFFNAKADAPLFETNKIANKDMAVYRAAMLPDDVMEAMASTLGKLGFLQVQTMGLKPAGFGSEQGFRFDITMTSSGGLQYKGMATFAQIPGKLEAVIFIAPEEYYFDHYAGTVDKVFSSIQFTKPITKPAARS